MIDSIFHDSNGAGQRVLELRFARPPVNALSPEMLEALRLRLAEALTEDVGAIVLSGSAGMFSAGLDVPRFLQLDREGVRAAWNSLFGLLADLAASPVPTVAAITGHCPAGGCVIALFCDRRVMARGNYRIGLNEVRVGLVVPPSIHAAFAFAIGEREAARLATTGELISGEEALGLGLVDELVEQEEVTSSAVDWTRSCLALPSAAVAGTRAVARRRLVEACQAQGDEALEAFVDGWFEEETQAALKALVASLAART